MGIISKRKNKKFSYRPRHFEHDGDGSPFAMEHKFDKFRTTVGDNQSLKGKFKTAWGEFRETSDKNTRFRLFLILGFLLLVFLFIIDFDLSIFYQ